MSNVIASGGKGGRITCDGFWGLGVERKRCHMSWFLGIQGRKEHVSHVTASGIQGEKRI